MCIFFPRETRDGLYSVGHYLVFKFIEEAILALATSLVLSVIVFLGTGLRGNFLLFWMVYWITSCTGIGEVDSQISSLKWSSSICDSVWPENANIYVSTLQCSHTDLQLVYQI